MTAEIRFEWNARKAESNKRRHGVTFEQAALALDDPFVYEFEEGNDHGEIRHRAIAKAARSLLFVSYVSFEEDDEEVVRIISARKASRQEHRTYERHAETYR